MINGKSSFDQPMKNELGTYDNIQKTAKQLEYYYFIVLIW